MRTAARAALAALYPPTIDIGLQGGAVAKLPTAYVMVRGLPASARGLGLPAAGPVCGAGRMRSHVHLASSCRATAHRPDARSLLTPSPQEDCTAQSGFTASSGVVACSAIRSLTPVPPGCARPPPACLLGWRGGRSGERAAGHCLAPRMAEPSWGREPPRVRPASPCSCLPPMQWLLAGGPLVQQPLCAVRPVHPSRRHPLLQHHLLLRVPAPVRGPLRRSLHVLPPSVSTQRVPSCWLEAWRLGPEERRWHPSRPPP